MTHFLSRRFSPPHWHSVLTVPGTNIVRARRIIIQCVAYSVCRNQIGADNERRNASNRTKNCEYFFIRKQKCRTANTRDRRDLRIE